MNHFLKNQAIILTALKYYGTHELLNGRFNPMVDKFLDSCRPENIDTNENWCAAFVNFVLGECNIKGTNSLVGRSFQKIGERVPAPVLGDIAIFWRVSPNNWQSHVGFYINEDDDIIRVLGGNQSDSVRISSLDKKRLLEYRRV